MEANKRHEIEEVINQWEQQDSYDIFERDQYYWAEGFGSNGCFPE